jgi:hypothetical protein
MPLVSVLMVSHRDTPYLRPAVQSILTQTLRDLELVFVDNGSGMTPVDLGEMGRDPRLRWLPQGENTGIARGLNAGMNAARSEFVALLDYDDIALPGRLAEQVAALRANPQLGLVASAAQTIDEAGRVTGRQFTLLTEREHRVFSNFDMPVVTPTITGWREVLLRYPYRECFSAAPDYDMFTRIVDTMPTRALATELGQYRKHREQTTVQRRDSQTLNACIIRLITARRRAGRPEGLAELMAELQPCLSAPPQRDVQYGFFARRCLQERFPLLAVYFARKMLSLSRTSGRLVHAFRILAVAAGQQPQLAAEFGRLFFTGPLRAYGLKPV